MRPDRIQVLRAIRVSQHERSHSRVTLPTGAIGTRCHAGIDGADMINFHGTYSLARVAVPLS